MFLLTRIDVTWIVGFVAQIEAIEGFGSLLEYDNAQPLLNIRRGEGQRIEFCQGIATDNQRSFARHICDID